MPRRGAPLGQHFLADARIQQRILDSLHLTREHLVIELGAGHGAITGMLAERAGRVVAIEVDPLLAAEIREKFSGNAAIEIIEGDILTLPLDYRHARIFG